MSTQHINAISNRLSLRPPQRTSLEILARICEIIPLKKDRNVAAALDAVQAEFSTVTDFERGSRSEPFKNVIYSYPLSNAMADGFVKEPTVATRENFDAKNFVAETPSVKYLCEPKAANEMTDDETQSKAKAASNWCKHATAHEMKHGGVSECRNKALQTMFQLIGGGEKAGSGIDKIRMGWTSQHWRSPNYSETARPDRVILRLPMLSLLPEGTIDHLQKRFGRSFSHLTRDEIQALVTAEIENQVTNARLQEITGKHPADLTLVLRGLADRHFLLQRGKARWTTYSLPEMRGERSIQSSGSSIQSSGRSIQSLEIDKADPTQDVDLLKIDQPAREKTWLNKAIMSNIIKDLCRNRFLTLDQIAVLTRRSIISIRNQHVKPMVKEGVLRLRYPERPNHPNQGYKLVERKGEK